MSLRTRLTWAFILVALMALLLAFFGLNLGMYGSMMGGRWPMMGLMMMPDHMPGLLAPILRSSLYSSLIAFIIAGLAGYWTAGRITRGLVHLRDAAQRLDLRDLTQRVPVEGGDEIADLARTFNRMGDRLETEERGRRQLLADVAHELRHPLAVLQGRLDLMQDGAVPLDHASLLPLQDEVIRLTRLVGDLRDLSLAEVGRLSLHMGPVDVGGLLGGLFVNLEPVAVARSVNLRVEAAPDLPAVQADGDRLRQVFVNLIANALQYTPAGGSVRVEARPDAGSLRVAVCDSGPGIPAEDLPHLFDRFYRADKSRTRATGGSGLGLAIVRSLVELHGGRVSVESREGQGSCFTVLLPFAARQ